MNFDLLVPSKNLVQVSDIETNRSKFTYTKLHPNSKIRHTFYKTVLEPAGHALTIPGHNPFTNYIILRALSQEYIDALTKNPQFLQALATLIQ